MPRQGKVIQYDDETGRILDLDEGDIWFNFSSGVVIEKVKLGDLVTFDVLNTEIVVSAVNVTPKPQEEGA